MFVITGREEGNSLASLEDGISGKKKIKELELAELTTKCFGGPRNLY